MIVPLSEVFENEIKSKQEPWIPPRFLELLKLCD